MLPAVLCAALALLWCYAFYALALALLWFSLCLRLLEESMAALRATRVAARRGSVIYIRTATPLRAGARPGMRLSGGERRVPVLHPS